MLIKNTLKNIYNTIKLKHYVLSKGFRVPKNYNSIATDFVNKKNLASSTKYLIWVDTENFQVNIFKGTNHKWILNRNYICSIGKPSTPTPKGT